MNHPVLHCHLKLTEILPLLWDVLALDFCFGEQRSVVHEIALYSAVWVLRCSQPDFCVMSGSGLQQTGHTINVLYGHQRGWCVDEWVPKPQHVNVWIARQPNKCVVELSMGAIRERPSRRSMVVAAPRLTDVYHYWCTSTWEYPVPVRKLRIPGMSSKRFEWTCIRVP